AQTVGQALRRRVLGDGAEEIRVVVEELEFEARRLTDDVADVAEARLVFAGDLDDDVLVAGRHRGFSQAELVDATVNDVLRLTDGALADLALHAVLDPELEGALVGASREGEVPAELVEKALVDLRGVRGILHLELEARDVIPRRDDRYLFPELRVGLLRRAAVAFVQPEHPRKLDLHVLVVAVALVADRFPDVD